MTSDESLASSLRESLRELGITLSDFSRMSKIPLSTLKKVLAARGGISLSTLRAIVTAISKLEGKHVEPFIAVIAAVTTLSKVKLTALRLQDMVVKVREYGVSTLDEAIKASLKAQFEGAAVIVCAPVVAHFIKDLVSIPIVTLDVCEEDLDKAVRAAAEKLTRRVKVMP
ncbi:MAG: transcriptional regulator [Thermoprotei archaeon]|nr:MAG: transcriptional regulator [Thermoprotei archaeon]